MPRYTVVDYDMTESFKNVTLPEGTRLTQIRWLCHNCGQLVEPGTWCNICGREFVGESDEDAIEGYTWDKVTLVYDAKTRGRVGCPRCRCVIFNKTNQENLLQCNDCRRMIVFHPKERSKGDSNGSEE